VKKEKKAERQEEKIPLRLKTGNPHIFCDIMRLYTRSDEHCVLCFASCMQTKNDCGDVQIEAFEQARIIVTNDHAKQIVEVICRNLNYYPVRSPDNKNEPPPVA